MRFILIAIFIIIGARTFAGNEVQATDSLLRLLNTTHSSEVRIQIYRHLADIHLDNAKKYLLKMYEEASKINDTANMLEALNDIIIEEDNSSNVDSTLKYIECIKKINAPEELKILLPFYHMRVFDSKCIINRSQNAINDELRAQKAEDNKTKDAYEQTASTYVMGSGLYMNKEYEKAYPYLKKALKMAESLPEKKKFMYQRLIAWKLCFASGRIGKNTESLKIMENIINLADKEYNTNYKKQRPFYKIELYMLQYYSYMISGLTYLTPAQEMYYWKRTQEIGAKLTNDSDKYSYFLSVNNYYYSNRTKKDLPKAIAANDSLIRIAKTLTPRSLSGLYATNSKLYEESKDYMNALKFLKLSHHLNDSLTSESSRQQLSELQVKYDVNTLNSENAKLEIQNKKTMLTFVTVLLIVFVLACAYLYSSLNKERRMKAKLKSLNIKAQESEKMKQAFINSICHEIRTPLNSIVGFSDLVMNEEIDLEMRLEFPAEIQKNTVLLTNLVNSMLEVANLDVSEEKLPCKPTDLRNICVEEMRRQSAKSGITYSLDIPEENTSISTNAEYLTQVIAHLLNNANKFTHKGNITLGYRIDKSQEKVIIQVTDTGCGIPKEKYEEVFNRFSKLDTFIPGNGLGLYLCHLIVKRLTGEIHIDPDYTEGTRMVVILPIR